MCLPIVPEGNLRLPSPSSIAAPTRSRSKPSLRIPLLLAALAALLLFLRHHIHFDWTQVLAQLRRASLLHIALGIALIVSTNWLRSWRWTVFLRPTKPVPPFSLLNTQFLGFTAVALFGRLADLTRPYLVSRRTTLPLASQIAVYTVERIFDLGAVAILFATMLFFTPASTPHHHTYVRAGTLALAAAALLALFTLTIRLAGSALDATARSILRPLSPLFASRAAHKLLQFRAGLNTLGSLPDLILALGLSLAMWLLIAASYLQTVHAFPHTPTLATLTFPAVMPLMAASMGGSLLQLPILGWFTQIALTSTAMHTLYGAPLEDATACATVLLLVNTLCVVPVGILLAHTERLSLRVIAQASHAPQQPPQSALS